MYGQFSLYLLVHLEVSSYGAEDIDPHALLDACPRQAKARLIDCIVGTCQ